jgi:hypothetical protein
VRLCHLSTFEAIAGEKVLTSLFHAWVESCTPQEAKHGPIEEWDTSKVTAITYVSLETSSGFMFSMQGYAF